jgi:hypothetical protein
MRKGVVVALLTLALAPTAAPADPSNPVAEVIVGDQILEGGTHTYNVPIVVAPGSSWTIRNANVFLDWTPPICTSGTAGYCQPNIMVLPGGTLRIENSVIDSTNWTIDDPRGGYTITSISGILEFSDSHFEHFTAIGAQGESPAPSVIRNNTFRWAIQGFSWIRGYEAHVEGNRFDHIMYSVGVRDASGSIINNHITNGTRHFATNPFGRGIDVQFSLVGEKTYETRPLVRGNLLEDGHQGILSLNGFDSVFSHNTIRNHAIGVTVGLPAGETSLNHTPPIFKHTVIQDTLDGLTVYVSGAPETREETPHLDWHQNSFLGSTCSAIKTLPALPGVTLTVNGNDNWWGSASGPSAPVGCPLFDGSGITVDSWLTEPPAED